VTSLSRIVAAAALIALAASFGVPRASARAQEDGLPDGPGKKILIASCTSCHELTEVTKLRGYYTKDEWRDVVVTMVKYGAVLKDKEQDVLVDYLAANLGKKER
jgi:competence protein ComEA